MAHWAVRALMFYLSAGAVPFTKPKPNQSKVSLKEKPPVDEDYADILTALKNMGYSSSEAKEAIASTSSSQSLDERLQKSLTWLGNKSGVL